MIKIYSVKKYYRLKTKMKTLLILSLLSAIGLKLIIATDWCGLPSCNGRQHIDCILGEAGSWGADCPDNKTMLDLRPVQDIILANINNYRNNIAGGKVAGFPTAKRMGTVVWNITLANLARENVRQCVTKNDGCRNTPDLNFVGQNTAWKTYYKTDNIQNIDALTNLTDLWYEEIEFATVDNINPYEGDPPEGKISHFTQLIKDYATKVGCAASKCTVGDDASIYFTCNFDLANVQGWPTYIEGPAASGCQTGKNTTYTNLCSTAEVFNVNTFWLD